MPEQSEAALTPTAFVQQLLARDIVEKNLCGHEMSNDKWAETCVRPKPCAEHGREDADA